MKFQLSLSDKESRCALVHAAIGGHVSVVSFLLECDWSPAGDTCRSSAIRHAFVRAAATGMTKVGLGF